jgi:hypothetical protein
VSSGWVAYWRARYTVAHHLRQPGIRGPTDPYIVRGSRTKMDKLQTKPRPIPG